MMLSPLKTLNAIGAFRSTSNYYTTHSDCDTYALQGLAPHQFLRSSRSGSLLLQSPRKLGVLHTDSPFHHSDQNGRQWSKQLLISLRFEELPSNHCELPVENDEHLFCHRKFRSKFIYISMKQN